MLDPPEYLAAATWAAGAGIDFKPFDP